MFDNPDNAWLDQKRTNWKNLIEDLQEAMKAGDKENIDKISAYIIKAVNLNWLPLGYTLSDNDHQSYPLIQIIRIGGSLELVEALFGHLQPELYSDVLGNAKLIVNESKFDAVYKNKILAIIEKNMKRNKEADVWKAEMAKLLTAEDKESYCRAIQEKVQRGKLPLDTVVRGGYHLLSNVIANGGTAEFVKYLIERKIPITDDAIEQVHIRIKRGKDRGSNDVAEAQKIFEIITNARRKIIEERSAQLDAASAQRQILESEPAFQASPGAPNEMAKKIAAIHGKALQKAFILHMTPLGSVKTDNPAIIQFTVTSYDKKGKAETQDYLLDNGRVKKANGKPGDNEWPSLKAFLNAELLSQGYQPIVPRKKMPNALLQEYLIKTRPKDRPEVHFFPLSQADYLEVRKGMFGDVKRREENLLFPSKEPPKDSESQKLR